MGTTDAAVADLLRRGLAKITPEGAWTQRAYARNATKRKVRSNSSVAVCWCALGAIGHDFWLELGSVTLLAAGELRAAIGGAHIHSWNDTPGRTQAEVIAAFTTALGAVERRLRDADVMRGVVEP